MSVYKGAEYQDYGTTTFTLNTTNFTYKQAVIGAAYNVVKTKTRFGEKYVRDINYYEKDEHSIIGRMLRVTHGSIKNSDGTLTTIWDKPQGIKKLLNVAMVKTSPFTLVVAQSENTSVKAKLTKVTPTGLEDLQTPKRIHIAGFGDYNDGKIVLLGIDKSGNYAIWDCNDETYNFSKIWTDNTTSSSTYWTDSFITSHWEYGRGYNYIRFSNVNIALKHNDTNGKVISYCYDVDYDGYYLKIHDIDQTFGVYNYSDNCYIAGGEAGKAWIRYQDRPSYIYPNQVFSHVTFTGGDLISSYAENYSGMVRTGKYSSYGWIEYSENGFTYWKYLFEGDKVYRYAIHNPITGYIWAIGDSNTNYWRSVMIPSSTNYYTSKVTFPTSIANYNRVLIPSGYVLLLNSSTLYGIDYDKLHSGIDQTVTTTTLKDPSGNNFTAKQASWNAFKNEGNMNFAQGHTFYVSTNDTNGLLMSETVASYGISFLKETIEAGGPVIVPRRNAYDIDI